MLSTNVIQNKSPLCYAECRYAECHYAECHGAPKLAIYSIFSATLVAYKKKVL
jgi:hypothetical protein